MKIWAISDTHGMHEQLKVPDGIDLVIHAGDVSNSFNRAVNFNEVSKFLEWWKSLPMFKVLIAGNHDSSIETNMHGFNKLDGQHNYFLYLEHREAFVQDLKLFGSPYTPTFGQWSFMKDRGKLDKYWQHIPEGLDILITHGPPKGILDLSIDRDNNLDQCGDSALWNHVMRAKPKVHIFGHIHNFKSCKNQGVFERDGIKFINASCVEDGKFEYGLTSNGVVFDI